MARFKKDIVSEGEFWVNDPDTNTRHKTVLTRARFAKWLESFNKSRAKGYNIPAPFDHDTKNAVPLRFGRDGVPSALSNAGFIESLTQEIRDAGDGKSVAVLVGEFDVPGDENDPTSPAGRIGKTIRDTSVYIRPNYTDGTGEVHEEGFMHAALCVLPIQPGQANFTSVPAPGLAIAMSQRVVVMSTGSGSTPGGLAAQFENQPDDDENTPEPGNTLGDPSGQLNGDIARRVVEALREAKVMDLPDDTSEETILQYILVAVRQKQLMPGTSSFVPPGQQPQTPPAGSPPGSVPPVPGATSSGQPPIPGQTPAADPLAAQSPAPGQPPVPGQPPSNPINLKKPPKAGVEQPPSIAMSHTPEQERALLMSQVSNLEAGNKLLANYVTNLEMEKRNARIAALVSSGRVTQAYADAQLVPALKGFTMSLTAEGKPATNPIDTILGALEAQPARTGSVINTLGNINLAGLPAESQAAVAGILMSLGGVNLPAGATEHGHPGGESFFAMPGTQTEAEAVATADQFLKNVNA